MCGYILYVCSGVCVWKQRWGGHRNATEPSPSSCASRCASPTAPAGALQSYRAAEALPKCRRSRVLCVHVLAAHARPVTAISSHGTMVVSMSCLRAMLGTDIHYPGRPQAKLRCVSQPAAEPPLDSGQAKGKKKQRAKAAQVNLNPFIQLLSALIGFSPIAPFHRL